MTSYDTIGGKSEGLDALSHSLEFSALVDEWVQDQFESVRLPPSSREQAITDILKGLPLGKELLEALSRVRDKIRDVFPQFSEQRKFDAMRKSDLRKYLIETLEKAIADGDMFIARDQDSQRIIGMAKASRLEKVGENSPVQGDVVEIGKAFIVPDVRGEGVYSQLRTQVINHVTSKYPKATLLTGTKNEAVKHMSRKAGWEEIPYGDYMRIHGASEEEVASHEKRMQAQGWCGFIYRPGVKSE